MSTTTSLVSYLLRLGDSSIVLGQQLCKWCAAAPMLEEDIALTNIALDCFGQGNLWLEYACELEGDNRTPDTLVYWRSDREYKNYLLTEAPNGDFACTIARQFFIDVYLYHLYEALEKHSSDERIQAIAGKSRKEVAYHLRHARSWMIRLGDGTEESHRRLSEAVNQLAPYLGELYMTHGDDAVLADNGLIVSPERIQDSCELMMQEVCAEAGITIPEVPVPKTGGPEGIHTEHLGYILAEMQSLTRAHPGAEW